MRVNFTAQRVSKELGCEPGKSQTLHQDSNTPGLGLRVTAAGSRTYVYEQRLHGKTVRLTIGDVKAWTLDKARSEAARLRTVIDAGHDPREQAAKLKADHAARQIEAVRKGATLREAWDVYCAARRPHWSELHHRDHMDLAQPGGQPKKRGKGLTAPGPLAVLMPTKLADLTPKLIADWLAAESESRPARARLAMNLLRIFSTWADEQDAYAGLIDPKAVSAKLMKDMPKAGVRDDCLQREQLSAFFAAVRQLGNPTMEAYLIGLLMTGARREELATLRWDDVDLKWNSLHMADKVEAAGRTIPLTPFFKTLLLELKRINDTPPNVRQMREQYADKPWVPSPWVFSSKKSADGRLADPNKALHRVCSIAGIQPVTLHGLRRSFSTLSEWCELPTGIVAQVMGHRPSATAEKHYKVRPLDLLRLHHSKLEAWILAEAGIQYEATASTDTQTPKLAAVN
ncbi:integrase family protein [Paraburkholderia sediminicola]|uniref:tyrosine-type recombinase/integrase n=1 Tax=Paraburkholderia sediminicola TaxID=458836 RepID=UPI0038B85DB1